MDVSFWCGSDDDVDDLARHDDDLFRGFAFEPFLRFGNVTTSACIWAGVSDVAYSFLKRSLPLNETGYSKALSANCSS